MSALLPLAKSHRALAGCLEDQAQSAAKYHDEVANGVPDILHRMAVAHLQAAGVLDDQAKAEAGPLDGRGFVSVTDPQT